MASTKKMSKSVALSLLKLYFRRAEYSRKIGNMEIELELSYEDKVRKQNECYRDILEISKQLEGFDLGSIQARK